MEVIVDMGMRIFSTSKNIFKSSLLQQKQCWDRKQIKGKNVHHVKQPRINLAELLFKTSMLKTLKNPMLNIWNVPN